MGAKDPRFVTANPEQVHYARGRTVGFPKIRPPESAHHNLWRLRNRTPLCCCATRASTVWSAETFERSCIGTPGRSRPTRSRLCEVEVVAGEGETVAVLTLARDEVCPMEGCEILLSRESAAEPAPMDAQPVVVEPSAAEDAGRPGVSRSGCFAGTFLLVSRGGRSSPAPQNSTPSASWLQPFCRAATDGEPHVVQFQSAELVRLHVQRRTVPVGLEIS